MERITAAPEWEWWVVWYFFIGGLAAGMYFIAALIELVGTERDREMAKAAYYLAFPLSLVCAVLLTLDLGRPERFWHMLIQSETGRLMFKYWSPISVGAWVLLIFGGLSFLSFIGVLAEDGRLGLGRFRTQARTLHRGLVGMGFTLLCAGVGFFIASYTGVLLTTSNQPFWSDTPLLGGLFLASAAATGTALLLLVCLPSTSPASLARLQGVNSWALGLELLLLVAFLASLGPLATPLLSSSYGKMLLGVTGLLGLVVPLGLRVVWRRGGGKWLTVATCLLILIGGFEMRYSVLMAAQHLLVAGR
jgi:formate-dependent nitrite reductase membrane component NrfD